MLKCWTCKNVLMGEPDFQPDPEEEESSGLVTTCPKCLTRHFYVEDEDGNMLIAEAMDTDDRVLHSPSA